MIFSHNFSLFQDYGYQTTSPLFSEPSPAPNYSAAAPCTEPTPIPMPVPAPVPVPIPTPSNDNIFADKVTGKELDVTSIITKRLNAMRKLQENPMDSEAIKLMYRTQKDVS